MSTPSSPEQLSPNSEFNEDELRDLVTNRRSVAEVRLARIATGFINAPEFKAKDTLLPMPFIKAVKSYLAHPEVSLPMSWPPRVWAQKPGLQDAVETFRFPADTDSEALLSADKVFGAIEAGLVDVSRLTPGDRPEVMTWRSLAKACHRLRTDELSHCATEQHDPHGEMADDATESEWGAIIVKLQESRPKPEGESKTVSNGV